MADSVIALHATSLDTLDVVLLLRNCLDKAEAERKAEKHAAAAAAKQAQEAAAAEVKAEKKAAREAEVARVKLEKEAEAVQLKAMKVAKASAQQAAAAALEAKRKEEKEAETERRRTGMEAEASAKALEPGTAASISSRRLERAQNRSDKRSSTGSAAEGGEQMHPGQVGAQLEVHWLEAEGAGQQEESEEQAVGAATPAIDTSQTGPPAADSFRTQKSKAAWSWAPRTSFLGKSKPLGADAEMEKADAADWLEGDSNGSTASGGGDGPEEERLAHIRQKVAERRLVMEREEAKREAVETPILISEFDAAYARAISPRAGQLRLSE